MLLTAGWFTVGLITERSVVGLAIGLAFGLVFGLDDGRLLVV